MGILHEEVMRVNSGASWLVRKGQRIRVGFESVIDFVVFKADNVSVRFDQARTKSNQGKIYLSTGDKLYAKTNDVLMTIVKDTYKGHHDLQYGMCSGKSFDDWWRQRESPAFKEWFERKGVTRREDLPLWGCYENITNALQNHPILALDIPAPFNIGQSVDIDPATGRMTNAWHDRDIPDPGTHIDLRAEVDCLCAASVGPAMGKLFGRAKPAHITIFDE